MVAVFKAAGKSKGPIPVCGTVNRVPYRQTLMRFRGMWRLYINTSMLKNSPKRIGEKLTITLAHDPNERSIATPPLFIAALKRNKTARLTFQQLPPSRQKEIVRYLAHLKTEESLQRNVARAIAFLCGKESFAGRAKPC